MKLLWITAEAGNGPGESADWRWDAGARLVARGHRIHQLTLLAHGRSSQVTSSPEHRAIHVPEAGFDEALEHALAAGPDVVHVMSAGGLLAPRLQALARTPALFDLWDAADAIAEPGHLGWAAAVAARSAWVREALAGAVGRPVERLEPGVDTMRFRPDAPPAADPGIASAIAADGRPRVLWLGPPSATRGAARLLDLLVALHARVPNLRLFVTGTDPEQPRAAEVLLAEARELGLLDAFALLPHVPPADLPAVIASCDVALAPTPAPEPVGFHVRLALASGVPVVAHATGATREIMADRRHGRLVPAGGLAGFAQAVADLLRDASWRADCAEQARLAAIERFDLEPSLYALEDLYHRLRTDAQRLRRPAA